MAKHPTRLCHQTDPVYLSPEQMLALVETRAHLNLAIDHKKLKGLKDDERRG